MDLSVSEFTPEWTFAPVSDTLTLKSTTLVTFEIDWTIGTFGGVVLEEVVWRGGISENG